MRKLFVLAGACALACLVVAPADAAKKSAMPKAMASPTCAGSFSNGASVDIANPQNQIEVGYVGGSLGHPPKYPAINGSKVTSCDVMTFSWNQFLYLTANDPATKTARFMEMAPWYNLLVADGHTPAAYPGGPTGLETGMLDQGQAGNDNHLLDIDGQTVRYDIRFNQVMYDSVISTKSYTQKLFTATCQPDPNTGACAAEKTPNNASIWLSPQFANDGPEAGSVEVKTAWRDFGAPGKCPADFYCQGRFGLVGLHYVNKTFYHGEWIWATFEHVANDPDCAPGGDTPIAAKSPIGTDWSFFNVKTVPPSVMQSKVCSTSGPSPQCNSNPITPGGWVPIDVCRTVPAGAPGGANGPNCLVSSSNIEGNLACLNAAIRPKLSGPWKNYKLVGALWVKNGMGFMQDFRVAGFQTPMPGFLNATPAGFEYLANTTMETWFQHNSNGYRQKGAIMGTGGADAGCFLCHNLPSSFKQGGNKQMDLSHFPGKLPGAKLMALRKALIAADSTAPAPK